MSGVWACRYTHQPTVWKNSVEALLGSQCCPVYPCDCTEPLTPTPSEFHPLHLKSLAVISSLRKAGHLLWWHQATLGLFCWAGLSAPYLIPSPGFPLILMLQPRSYGLERGDDGGWEETPCMHFASAPSLVGFICFSSAECGGKFFSCAFQFEEMLVKERLLEFLCHFGYFFLNL